MRRAAPLLLRSFAGLAALVAPFALMACGGPGACPCRGDLRASAPRPAAPPDAGPPADPLGPRPDLGEPAAYAPPVPVRYEREGGLTVWLLERHGLPIVSMQVVVPAGSSHDPEGKEGLALVTANMLDEGAGRRDAIEVSRDLDRLGADLSTGAYADYGFAQLTVLKKNLEPAAAIFGDVVARPRMSPVEWKRVHDLWQNQLRARQSDPEAVSNVVVLRSAYPPGHPYAHPPDGVLASAASVRLDDVKAFYAARWHPERATCVVVGDVTRAELDPLLDRALAGWKPARKARALTTPAAPAAPAPAGRRVVVVDRPDAPQSVIAVARPGVSVFDEGSAPLARVNAALGGTFTSRLNQDLREEHGWTYGAHSRFSFSRLRGSFVARAAVQTEHTGEALKAMLADIDAMAKGGLTDEEVDKTRKHARADLVEAFETVSAAAARLGRSAGVEQAPDHEAVTSRLVDRADKATLDRLASSYLDLSSAVVVVVGPRARIEPQLASIGIHALEASDPEGK